MPQRVGRTLAIRVVVPIALMVTLLSATGITAVVTVNREDARTALKDRAAVTVRLTGVMTRLAAGERAVDVPSLDRRDEIGRVAEAVQVFKEQGAAKQRLEAEQVELCRQAEAERHAAIAAVADDFERRVGSRLGEVMRRRSTPRSTACAARLPVSSIPCDSRMRRENAGIF